MIILDLLKKLVTRPKDLLLVILLIVAAIQGWLYTKKKHQLAELNTYIEGLPKDTKQIVTIEKNTIKIVNRDKEGKTIYNDRFIPSEGKVEIITKNNSDVPEVHIKDKGFTCRPGLGAVSDLKDLKPSLDFKIAYWKRYSAGVGFTDTYSFLWASRHVDDWSGFLHLSNVELMAGYGRYYSNLSEGTAVVGLRINF